MSGTLRVSAVRQEDLSYRDSGSQASDAAAIKRAAKAVGQLRRHNASVQLPRTSPVWAKAAAGTGLIIEEGGRRIRLQAWGPGPYPRSVWLAAYGPEAHFRGEYRLGQYDASGNLTLWDSRSYNASGHKAHRSDGSSCYGSMSYQSGYGCPGCKADQIAARAREHIGRRVAIRIDADPSYGTTWRWGQLLAVSDGLAVFDDLADSSGWTDKRAQGALGLVPDETVTVKIADIHELKAA
jgi:hypothetical protein